MSVAASQSFYNATGAYEYYSIARISGDNNGTELGDYFAQHNSEVFTPTDGPAKPTVLGPGFYNRAGSGSSFTTGQTFYAQNTLLHEFLHAYLILSDAQILQYFSPYGLSPYASGNTEAISAWVSADCKSTPGYLTWTQETQQTP